MYSNLEQCYQINKHLHMVGRLIICQNELHIRADKRRMTRKANSPLCGVPVDFVKH